MRKIYILLCLIIGLVSCKNDIETTDWTADSLSILSQDGRIEDAGDGNLKLILPAEFAGGIKLDIQCSSSWTAEVVGITNEDDAWLSLSTMEGNGNSSIDVIVSDNETNADRKTSIVIKTGGNIPVKKTLTVIQGNIDELLNFVLDKDNILAKGVNVTEQFGGSYRLILPIDFNTTIEGINVIGTASWNYSIVYSNEESDWIIVEEEDTEMGKCLNLNINSRVNKSYREANIIFTATKGEITVQKNILVSQLGESYIDWSKSDYFQGDVNIMDKAELIFSSEKQNDLVIGQMMNIKGEDLELPDLDWCSLRIDGDKLMLSLEENNSTNSERTKTIEIKNKNLQEKKYTVNLRQCASGHGIVLNRKLWTVIGDGDKKDLIDEDCRNLYDGYWPTYSGMSSNHLEINQNHRDNAGSPYYFIIDLGENFLKDYNSLGLMPRLEWAEPSPKRVSVEVSDNGNEWTSLISAEEGNGFTKDEIYHDHDWLQGKGEEYYCSHWEGIVKWYTILTPKRYIRLGVYESYYAGNNGTVICFNELFVSRR